MSPAPHPSPPSASHARLKLLVAGPLAAVAVLGLGAAGVARLPGGGAAPAPGEGLRIEVVQPPAPAVDPGSRMDVGELVDGYRHVNVRRGAPEDAFGEFYAEAWLEPAPPLPEPPRLRRDAPGADPRMVELRPTARQASMEDRSGPENPYGFDAPAPDYRAERRARRERMARLEMELAEVRAYRESRGAWRPVPSYGPPPRLERETAFY